MKSEFVDLLEQRIDGWEQATEKLIQCIPNVTSAIRDYMGYMTGNDDVEVEWVSVSDPTSDIVAIDLYAQISYPVGSQCTNPQTGEVGTVTEENVDKYKQSAVFRIPFPLVIENDAKKTTEFLHALTKDEILHTTPEELLRDDPEPTFHMGGTNKLTAAQQLALMDDASNDGQNH